jgi:cysteine desulfurase
VAVAAAIATGVMAAQRIWMDHAVESPPLPRALDAVRALLIELADGGPLPAARRAAELASARRAVADLLTAREDEIVLTSGGTEAANLAIKGVAAARAAGPRRVVTTAAEPLRLLHPIRSLARAGFEPVILPVDARARLDPAALERALARGAAIVSLELGNSEVGTLQDLPAITAISRRHGVPLHLDATAAAALVPIDVRTIPVDLLSVSASRLGGLPGTGALFVRDGVTLLPLVEGGIEEQGRRAGGENLIGLAALAAAAREMAPRIAAEGERVRRLRDRLEAGLIAAVPGLVVHGAPGPGRLPGHLAVAIPGAEGEAIVLRLLRRGVCASTGSPCADAAGKASHVLLAMGIGPAIAGASIRLSLGGANEVEEIPIAVAAIAEAATELRRISGWSL